MNKTGDILKELRSIHNITQSELAEKIGCSVKTINRYETNKSLIETHNLIQLALYFDVPTDYLLGLANQDDDSKIRIYFESIIKKSKSNKPIEGDEYYWIFKDEKQIGGHTQWKGFTDNRRKEIRTLRPVIPTRAIEVCTELYEPPMIINTWDEAIIFSIYGGQAIIKKSICRTYLPEFWEDFITKSSGDLS